MYNQQLLITKNQTNMKLFQCFVKISKLFLMNMKNREH